MNEPPDDTTQDGEDFRVVSLQSRTIAIEPTSGVAGGGMLGGGPFAGLHLLLDLLTFLIVDLSPRLYPLQEMAEFSSIQPEAMEMAAG